MRVTSIESATMPELSVFVFLKNATAAFEPSTSAVILTCVVVPGVVDEEQLITPSELAHRSDTSDIERISEFMVVFNKRVEFWNTFGIRYYSTHSLSRRTSVGRLGNGNCNGWDSNPAINVKGDTFSHINNSGQPLLLMLLQSYGNKSRKVLHNLG